MSHTLRDTLYRLLDAPGPSGFETEAADVWRDVASDFSSEVWSDVHGNSFASNGVETVSYTHLTLPTILLV